MDHPPSPQKPIQNERCLRSFTHTFPSSNCLSPPYPMCQEHRPSKLTLLTGTDPWLFMVHQVQGLICTATQGVGEKIESEEKITSSYLFLFSLYVSVTQERNNEMTKAVFEVKPP